MSPKIACLCLVLVLVSTWTDRLKTGDFFVAPPTGTPSFGEEIYPLANSNATFTSVGTAITSSSS